MIKSIKNFVKLCFFRGSPSDVDGSTVVLAVLFLTFFIVSAAYFVLTIWLSSGRWFIGDEIVHLQNTVVHLLSTICAQLFVALCIYAVLHVQSMSQKFRQTFSSYLGVNIFIILVTTVLIVSWVGLVAILSGQSSTFFRYHSGNLFNSVGSILLFVTWVSLGATVWKILAFGYVLYKSLEVKFWQCGILAIMVIYAPEVLVVFSQLFRSIGSAIWYVLTVGFF